MGGVNKAPRTSSADIARRMEQDSQRDAQKAYYQQPSALEGLTKFFRETRVGNLLATAGVAASIYGAVQFTKPPSKEVPVLTELKNAQDHTTLQCLREEFQIACENALTTDWFDDNCDGKLPEFETLEERVNFRDGLLVKNGLAPKTERWECKNLSDGETVARFSAVEQAPKAQTPPEENQPHLVEQQLPQTPDSY